MTSGTTRVEVRETPDILSLRKRDGQVGTRSRQSTIATAVHGDGRSVSAGESHDAFEESMQLPNIDNFIKDREHGVTYNICAYRKLSSQEMTRAMQVFIQQQGGRQPKPGTVVKIFSLVGLGDQ
ncbi:hypothetical protein [Paraburkholderia nemoris]|nr:hypothetical protein [Paraburkholderia nemoris]